VQAGGGGRSLGAFSHRGSAQAPTSKQATSKTEQIEKKETTDRSARNGSGLIEARSTWPTAPLASCVAACTCHRFLPVAGFFLEPPAGADEV
jgi:hypothetical protein